MRCQRHPTSDKELNIFFLRISVLLRLFLRISS